MEGWENQEEVETYIDNKEYVYDCMNFYADDFVAGSSFAFDELEDPDDVWLLELYVACALYELEHGELEEWLEAYMTHNVYRYKRGDFKGMIPDEDLFIADVKKIESLMKLRFEDLIIYDSKDGVI